jgi:hypothetical protein
MSSMRSLFVGCAQLPFGRPLLVVAAVVGVLAPATVAAGDSFTDIPHVGDVKPEARVAPTDDAAIVQASTRDQQAAAGRQQLRASAGERAARVRSRTAYRGRGRAAALSVADQTLGPLLKARLWAPPKIPTGEQVVGYTGDHLIRIRQPGKKVGAAIYSPFPTRVRDASGDREPTDLALRDSGQAFETKNAPVAVALPKQLSNGVTLGDTGVSVRPPVSDTASSGVEQAGKVFWSDVATDTDFMVAPMPFGIETFHILRSADAAEQLPLMLDLPADASLRYARWPSRPSVRSRRPIVQG